MSWRSGAKLGRLAVVLPVLSAAALVSGPVRAAEDGRVRIELNKLEPQKDACRAYLVLKNATDKAFKNLKLDLVMFDGEGVVARRVAVQGAPLAAGKTSLKVFDIQGVGCPGIGRILLNNVLECDDASGSRDDCIGMISTSSRAAAPLVK